MKLDFSGIDKIAYKGFEDHEERDSLIEQGYTLVPEEENPFSQPQEAAVAPQPEPTADMPQTSKNASQRPRRPSVSKSGGRDYKSLYRAAYEFHERHTPPTVDRDYWRDHRPGEDDTPQAEVDYWTEAAKDVAEISKAHDGDPFLIGLLHAVYEELEREYKALRGDGA